MTCFREESRGGQSDLLASAFFLFNHHPKICLRILEREEAGEKRGRNIDVSEKH